MGVGPQACGLADDLCTVVLPILDSLETVHHGEIRGGARGIDTEPWKR